MQREFTAWSTNRSVRSKDERFVPQPNGLGEPIHLELSLVEAGRGIALFSAHSQPTFGERVSLGLKLG